MGRCRSNNIGFLDEVASLDIRTLHKQKLLVDGDFVADRISGIVCDLSGRQRPYVIAPTRAGRQKILLAARETLTGARRWFFIDDNGNRAEVLYLIFGRYQSRRSVPLTYRSQSKTRVAREMAVHAEAEQPEPVPVELTSDPEHRHLLQPFNKELSDQIIELCWDDCQRNLRSTRHDHEFCNEHDLRSDAPCIRIADLIESGYLKRNSVRAGEITGSASVGGMNWGAFFVGDCKYKQVLHVVSIRRRFRDTRTFDLIRHRAARNPNHLVFGSPTGEMSRLIGLEPSQSKLARLPPWIDPSPGIERW